MSSMFINPYTVSSFGDVLNLIDTAKKHRSKPMSKEIIILCQNSGSGVVVSDAAMTVAKQTLEETSDTPVVVLPPGVTFEVVDVEGGARVSRQPASKR
jgi:hypothetical protein